VSHREEERVATGRALWLALLGPLPFLLTALLPLPAPVGWILIGVTLGLPMVLLWPTGTPRGFAAGDPNGRIDERTVMFSRAALEPGTERFEAYYQEFPGHQAPDDHFRSLAGLMSPRAGKFEPVSFAAAAGTFDTVEVLAQLIQGQPHTPRVDLTPAAATRFVKGWTLKMGALDCGITALKAEHLYSVKGRGETYGQAIDLDHPHAIAFTVEMEADTLGTAPEGPTLMESSQQYLNAGRIAVQLAAGLRRMGWEAEAHIDANYKVVCPLVARDAGLGEIGRMGLLMTPRLGPRVRLAVVTTTLPLEHDRSGHDPSVLHFCSLCKKCADICPVEAIPDGPRPDQRWQIDSEACFSYWCAVGTDCGQCMRVCPYSHPDSLLHNGVRWGLRRSTLFRHVALRLDDLLYGRRPAPRPVPPWLPERSARVVEKQQ